MPQTLHKPQRVGKLKGLCPHCEAVLNDTIYYDSAISQLMIVSGDVWLLSRTNTDCNWRLRSPFTGTVASEQLEMKVL
eukprot:1561983-Amphidinium_carterae.1